jgi:TetR/AcrR family transcriptional repressor of nem operon
MARPKAFDEVSALEGAMGLFWEKGYEATSVRDLIGRIGISSSSLYATFGDKHDVYLEALAHYRVLELAEVRRALEGTGGVRAALRRFFDELVGALLADPERRGSFTLNAAVELGGRDPAVTGQLREHFDDIAALLADALADGQENGTVSDRASAPELARFVLHGLYSLASLVKVYPDPGHMRTIADLTLSILDPQG